ncbi:MAG: amidohydrolase family protein [Alphaproteobacteria bacterium]|mgnify:CR=1 FL=1
MPIFDAHVHYSQPAWSAFPPGAVFEVFDAAGVPRALVSSTPDDGTMTLYRANAGRVVPILRPYRGTVGSGNWYNDATLADYLEGRLKSGAYRGIGEFHLSDDASAGTAVVKKVVSLAVERDIPVHVHSGAGPVRVLFSHNPKLKVLWAHAGMIEPPEVVAALLEQYPQLTTEVSFRTGEIAPGGTLSPAWRALFLRHKDRILIGSDTYVTARWEGYRGIIEDHRAWLAQLPREVAEAIAYKNAVRLFGAGDRKELSN